MDFLSNINAFLLGFILLIISIFVIVKIARLKKLFEFAGSNKIHFESAPLGGISIFAGFILSSVICANEAFSPFLKYLIATLVLILFVGLEQDLVVIPAYKKYGVQVFAIIFLVLFGDFRITDLHGLFGISQISYIVSFLLSLLLILIGVNIFGTISNTANLVAGLAILSALVLGLWFYFSRQKVYAILSFALLGDLSGFFLYNIFTAKYKLHLGNTGSWIIGLIISVLVIQFNELNIDKNISFRIDASPSVSLAIIITPLINTLRQMKFRLMNNRLSQEPEKNDIYDEWLKIIPSHTNVTLILIGINTLIMATALFLNYFYLEVTLQFLFIFMMGLFFSILPRYIRKKK
jgi:UDP-N-acetylmuramyl pentapeptide phosphotransferase/UDP-N-acetylglucosamine-1-phosphate transferase